MASSYLSHSMKEKEEEKEGRKRAGFEKAFGLPHDNDDSGGNVKVTKRRKEEEWRKEKQAAQYVCSIVASNVSKGRKMKGKGDDIRKSMKEEQHVLHFRRLPASILIFLFASGGREGEGGGKVSSSSHSPSPILCGFLPPLSLRLMSPSA